MYIDPKNAYLCEKLIMGNGVPHNTITSFFKYFFFLIFIQKIRKLLILINLMELYRLRVLHHGSYAYAYIFLMAKLHHFFQFLSSKLLITNYFFLIISSTLDNLKHRLSYGCDKLMLILNIFFNSMENYFFVTKLPNFVQQPLQSLRNF